MKPVVGLGLMMLGWAMIVWNTNYLYDTGQITSTKRLLRNVVMLAGFVLVISVAPVVVPD